MQSAQHSGDGSHLHNRLVTGAVIVGITVMSVGVVSLLAWLLSRSIPSASPWGAPPPALFIAALVVLGTVLIGAGVLEAVSLLPHVRRPGDLARGRSQHTPTTALTRSLPPRITVLIPAHNEESSLPATLAALQEQSQQPDRVVVIADNCVDKTAEIARRAGCSVLTSQNNRARKAGALNQALARLLPGFDGRDLILVMDADTRLSPDFIREAAGILAQDSEISAVGGVFEGDARRGILAQLQRNEFARYARQLQSRRGRVFVLTGTATVFRATTLEEVASCRGGVLPGQRGKTYAESAITEDNELTLAMKSLGCYVISPHWCRVTTETMPTLGTLWTQRLRWQQGALENLNDYGMRPSTARYWLQQWGLAYGSIALPLSLIVLVLTPMIAGQWALLPFWLLVTVAFSLERGLSAWATGWRGRALAFSLIPEVVYSLFLQACFVRALSGMTTSSDMSWGHLTSAQAEAGA
jgi:cellulose synthase/poly-beta-1,6-N-acetylglucosamine synthase-like glycosyltransferase